MASRKAVSRAVPVYALAGIRIVNGAAGLLAPDLLIRRLDPDREPPSPAAVYAFRLFGIRTILLGLDLLTHRDERLRESLRDGVLIHGSDTATAATLGLSGRVAPRTAALTTLISATNTVLAAVSLANPVKGKPT
ncbi:hypothetical protein [Streptomyces sp. 3214.6]|uniref:hypothetical protein n=1 Tax=Streptomyces sp. 3214.6 TaxID=1882757 RepID=UPI00090B6BF5|nr:hypothetical protein [Streptomyces sp. 3214.6]SHI25164.1 hypothetical protein SAMN05444521_6190 [Streptomyces sp. 3214.6]